MYYIIYFDENYKMQVTKELGKIQELGEGVGLIKNITYNVNELTKEMQNLLKIYDYSEETIDLKTILQKSIFVRHYHKVDLMMKEFNDNDFLQLLSVYKNEQIAVRVVYKAKTLYKGLTQYVAELIEKQGHTINIKTPNVVISIYAGDTIYLSIDKKEELPTNYRAGAPHYAVGQEICRAEFKLLEAFERFDINSKNIRTAIDLGASPGGWTHTLADLNIKVSAVDPAELDSRVLKLKNVTHYKMTSQNYLKIANEKYDLIVDDMKMFGDKSSHIVCNCLPLLNKRSKLLMTIKLGETKLYEQIIQALNILKECFTIIQVKKLFYTRQEVIVYAQLKD